MGPIYFIPFSSLSQLFSLLTLLVVYTIIYQLLTTDLVVVKFSVCIPIPMVNPFILDIGNEKKKNCDGALLIYYMGTSTEW
jgi:hypothetical protein